jgi:hypothetical protein
MSSPLNNVPLFDFCGQRGVKSCEFRRRMLTQCGEKCTTQRKAYQWVEGFRSGTNVADDRSDRPTTSRTALSAERVNKFSGSRGQTYYCDTAGKLDISCGPARSSSTASLDITKFVQGGCQSSLQMSRNEHA